MDWNLNRTIISAPTLPLCSEVPQYSQENHILVDTTWTEGDLAPREALWPALLGRTWLLPRVFSQSDVRGLHSERNKGSSSSGGGGRLVLWCEWKRHCASPPPSSIPRVEIVRSTRWRPARLFACRNRNSCVIYYTVACLSLIVFGWGKLLSLWSIKKNVLQRLHGLRVLNCGKKIETFLSFPFLLT